MSFKGNWLVNVRYIPGDFIVVPPPYQIKIYIPEKYFVCKINHVSDNLTSPGHPEDIYWLSLNFDDELLYPHLEEQGAPKLPFLNYESEEEQEEECSYERKHWERKRKINTSSPPPFNLITEEQLLKKRKIKDIRKEIYIYKKKSNKSTGDLEEDILLLDIPIETKSFLLDKYIINVKNKSDSSESVAKSKNWFSTVLNIPYGKLTPFPVNNNSSKKEINTFFDNVKEKLDNKIYGLEYVKDEIMEFIARKITAGPNSKGHILALHGEKGVGKTVVLKTLAEALGLPFHQINFGGMSDSSILTGHSETYIGAKAGKIVEILSESNCMNPIIYFDEIDKISDSKSREINGVLTHLLDEEQNTHFQDNFLSNIPLDLSKAFFVIAFNDINKVNSIVADRMKIIHIKNPTIEEKNIIAKSKMIPEITSLLGIENMLNDELIKYTVNKSSSESGVRLMKKHFEKLFNKINYLTLRNDKCPEITTKFIDTVVSQNLIDNIPPFMYL
jgi:ATP-dependent Lon protease